MRCRQARQPSLAPGGEPHAHLAAVIRGSLAAHEAVPGQPIDEADRTVGTQPQVGGEGPHRQARACAGSFDGQHGLVLLGRQTRQAGGGGAELEEGAQRRSKGCQRRIVRLGERAGNAGHADSLGAA
ncbi:MAG TPA: hypothetical protein VLW52_15120 [Opitutaceae bacterium]|nr:hypothetical protein [Opitutaceae bacterium]